MLANVLTKAHTRNRHQRLIKAFALEGFGYTQSESVEVGQFTWVEVADSQRDLGRRKWWRVMWVDPSVVGVVGGAYIPYGLSRTLPTVLLLRKAIDE